MSKDKKKRTSIANPKTIFFKSFLRGIIFLIKKNWKVVIPFLLAYSVVNMIASSVFVKLCIHFAMLMHGDTYISPDNILYFMTAPSTILMLLLLCVLIVLLHTVGIAGVMHAYCMSMIGKKTSFPAMIAAGLRAGKRSFIPQNWTLFPFIMVLLPLTGFFTLSFSSVQAVMPGFIKAYITSNAVYSVFYYVLYFVLVIVEILFIFSMNFYLLQECSFTSACAKSLKLIKGRYFKTVLCLIITVILLFCATTSFSSIIAAVVLKISYLFPTTGVETNASHFTVITTQLSTFIGAILAPGVNVAALTQLFFSYLEDDNKLATMSRETFINRKWKPWQAVVAFVTLAALIGVYCYQSYDLWRDAVLAPPYPAIVAHRGDSVNAPENSYPAFRLASMEQVEVELDVHQTKDGVIIVSHDDNLKRICGKDVYVHDLTYDEIMQLDVGSWFSSDYAGLQITTLDEALKLLKDTYVQVEIKPNGMDEGIEERVLDIINANGMHNQVMILCLQPEPLIRVKELDPTMKTIYCMTFAWGRVTDIPFADFFSIEEQSITRELVAGIHKDNSMVYCWTINDERSLQYLADCRVDGIVTDNPLMIRRALLEIWHDEGAAGIIRYYVDFLRDVGGLI